MVKSATIVALASAIWAAGTAVASADPAKPATATGLDAPLTNETVALPNDGFVTCATYPDVTLRIQQMNSETNPVVQFIAAANAPATGACRPGKAAGAVTFDATLGLIGRKGSLFVFGDATGIDVFDLATRRRLHRGNVARGPDGLLPSDPKGMVVTADANGLRIGYRHEVDGICSMMTDRTCWRKLSKVAGLPADLAGKAPDCSAAYALAKSQPDYSSAIGFRRDVTITPAGKVTVAVSGPVTCRSL